jgi:osmotically-inducible protein OsmY
MRNEQMNEFASFSREFPPTFCGTFPTILDQTNGRHEFHCTRWTACSLLWNELFVRTQAGTAVEWDVLVPDDQIQSTVSAGWITLEGEVNNGRERSDAERAIRRLTGVVGVINKIEIRKQVVDENQLRAEIEDALETRAGRETERLRIEIHDGAVDLWGRVHSWQEKRAVIGSIAHAPGMTQLKDHLQIDPYF